jgi:hypothetical protein
MRKCPKCQKWSMDFDEYFSRFRCYDCGWMPPSTTEREIRLLRSYKQPQKLLDPREIPELGMTVTPVYDAENDALSFDFGLDEPTFDLPDPDGRLIWKIGRNSDNVAGFTIIGVNKLSLSQISVQFIARRKEGIERSLRRIPAALLTGRVTKNLIEQVIVTAVAEEPNETTTSEGDTFFREVESKLVQFTG